MNVEKYHEGKRLFQGLPGA
jgi:hypothetical protein